jgi:hypothetical protein
MAGALAGLVLVALAVLPQGAQASWHAAGGGSAYARAKAMPSGSTPDASVAGSSVSVSWAQSSFAGGGAVSGYVVKRYTLGGQPQTVGAGCSGTVSALTCTESNVPVGDWRYSVTPKHAHWLGAESPSSATVTVSAPALGFSSSTTVTSLPSTLDGTVSNYVPGQTVAFRLDNASTGTILSGTLSPTAVPASATASFTVTIPSGTANGAHTVYAIGSGGDTASAAITVDTTRAFTMAAWDVSDQSSGSAADVSDPVAKAGGPNTQTTGFTSTFGAARYLDYDLHGALNSGTSTSGVNFNFAYRGTTSSSGATTECFYFEVRRVSTGAVIGTHGSAGSPVGCNSALTFTTATTALPEVTSTDIANDLRVRVYLTNASSGGFTFTDLATVTGTAGGASFTLFDERVVNAALTQTTPWSLLASGDSSALTTSSAGWTTSFNTSRYLALTYPGYVPSGATAISASFTHSYRSYTTSSTTCWYFAVYSGATLLATHGSSASPVSCNSSSTTYVTETVALPEVDTVAEANSVVIRVYAKNSNSTAANRRSLHDVARVGVSYTP